MGDSYILSRKQLNASCRLNSAAVGAYLMAFPSILNNPPGQRPALRAYTELLERATTLLVNANYSLPSNKPIKALENIEWPDRNKILEINQLLKENEEGLNTTVKGFADQMQFNLQDNDDPLGLLTAYDAMTAEDQAANIFSFVHDIVESTEITQEDARLKAPARVKADGMTLETTNELFFKNPNELSGLAPAVSTMMLKKISDMGTNDKAVIKREMEKIHARYLIEPQEDVMIQITTKGHSISFGKTNGKYWQFNSLDGSYSTLTLYEDAADALEGMKKLADTAMGGIEFASINFELKNEFKPQSAIEKARIEQERKEIARSIVELMDMFQTHQESFELIRKKPLSERLAAYTEQVRILNEFKRSVESLNISDEHHGLKSSKSALLESIEAEKAKEDKLLKDWEAANEILQQIHHTRITLPKELQDFNNEIENLSMNIQILGSMLESYQTNNPALKAEIDQYLHDSLFNNAIFPLAQAAIDQAKSLESIPYSDNTLPQFLGHLENLSNVMTMVATHAPINGKAIYDEMEKLRDSINAKMPGENRFKF